MAGNLDLGQGRGGIGARRRVDLDLAPIPMIDLMMVLIAFLLITAVWSQMSRMDMSANVPNHGETTIEQGPVKSLHVEVQDDKFVLSWRTGKNIDDRFEVPRHPIETIEGKLHIVRYPDLSAKLQETWSQAGLHRDPTDKMLDRAVLHTPDSLAYRDLVAVLDALHSVKRPFSPTGAHGKENRLGAFEVVFAVD